MSLKSMFNSDDASHPINTAEDCCSACQERSGCNVWTFCPLPQGCDTGCPNYVATCAPLLLACACQLPCLMWPKCCYIHTSMQVTACNPEYDAVSQRDLLRAKILLLVRPCVSKWYANVLCMPDFGDQAEVYPRLIAGSFAPPDCSSVCHITSVLITESACIEQHVSIIMLSMHHFI